MCISFWVCMLWKLHCMHARIRNLYKNRKINEHVLIIPKTLFHLLHIRRVSAEEFILHIALVEDGWNSIMLRLDGKRWRRTYSFIQCMAKLLQHLWACMTHIIQQLEKQISTCSTQTQKLPYKIRKYVYIQIYNEEPKIQNMLLITY